MNPLLEGTRAVIEEMIPVAQQIWQESPARIGAVCAHPREKIVGELKEVFEGVATLSFPQQPDKQFPYAELFDPNVLKRLCLDLQTRGRVSKLRALGLDL